MEKPDIIALQRRKIAWLESLFQNPTEEMISAGHNAVAKAILADNSDPLPIWRAMLAEAFVDMEADRK